jgi:DNA relaxase NicK
MDSLNDSATIVQADVDWLSMSTHEPAGISALLEWRDARFAVLGDEGHREKQYSAHGYHYRSRGAVAIGVGRREVLCQISGGEAAASWRRCAAWATNVSRIDLAVTARPDVATSGLAQLAYRSAGAAPRGRGRAPELTLIVSQDRGDTLYVGSRKSDVLGRLYHKEKEDKAPVYAGCWRWEVQYRRAYALSALRALLASEVAEEALIGTVGRWFRDRGIGAPYRALVSGQAVSPPKPVADDLRWLTWARKSVAPRAKELADRYGWRFVAETLVGRISSQDDWESMMRDVEAELAG